MEIKHTDILIIGAGPAGSSAALAALDKGVDILMVERKKSVGRPVQCAEFIPARMVGDMDLDASICAQKIKGMQTFINGHLANQSNAPGFIIDREKLDAGLAKKAAVKGAILLTSTRAIKKVDSSKVLLKDSDGKKTLVSAKVIIGADGPLSTVRQWVPAPGQYLLPAVQMSFHLTTRSEFTRVYLDSTIKGGYGWVFPKVDSANVGLGFSRKQGSKQKAKALLTQFVTMLKDNGVISGPPYSCTAGWIPAQPMQNAVYSNTLLVGDAAGHTHPITGAGIFSALTCGQMAGEHAAAAVLENKTKILKRYDRDWRELFGRSLNHAYAKRKLMENEWHRFDEIIKSCWIAFKEYHANI